MLGNTSFAGRSFKFFAQYHPSKGAHVTRFPPFGRKAGVLANSNIGRRRGNGMVTGVDPVGTGPTGVSQIFTASFDTESKTDSRSIIEIVSFVNRSFIERLSRFKDDLRVIDRRQFEELIAELFVGFGYEVELTRRTRDGGKDIVAIKRREVNTKYLIECKRPAPGILLGFQQ